MNALPFFPPPLCISDTAAKPQNAANSAVVPTPEASSPDLDLETRICHAAMLVHTALTRDARVAALDELETLVKQRSEERIRQMELERGLAR